MKIILINSIKKYSEFLTFFSIEVKDHLDEDSLATLFYWALEGILSEVYVNCFLEFLRSFIQDNSHCLKTYLFKINSLARLAYIHEITESMEAELSFNPLLARSYRTIVGSCRYFIREFISVLSSEVAG